MNLCSSIGCKTQVSGDENSGRIPFAYGSREELEQLFRGYGYNPYFVEGDDPEFMHARMADVMDKAIAEIKHIQTQAREHGNTIRPRWPMIILRSPKGWTGTSPPNFSGTGASQK